MILIYGLAVYGGLMMWAPYAFEMSRRAFIRTHWFKWLTGTFVALLLLMAWQQPERMIMLPWLSSILLLAMVDAKTKSVRVIDLSIMSIFVMPLLNGRVVIQVLVLSGLFLMILMGLKFVLKKIYKQDALGGADIWVIVSILIALGGQPAMVALYSGVILSAIVGGGLLLIGKKQRRSSLPFIPFLGIGAGIAVFFSDPILNFYMKLIMMT